MAGKKFKYRVDIKNNIAIKGNRRTVKSDFGERRIISVGLDKDFNLLNRYIIKDNVFIPYSIDMQLKRGKGGSGFYYMMNELSYMCVVSAQYNNRGVLVDKSLIMYIPKVTFSEKELYFTRVTGEIEKEKYDRILNNLVGITSF